MENTTNMIRLLKETSYKKMKDALDTLNFQYDVLTTLDEYLSEDTPFNESLFRLETEGFIYYNDIDRGVSRYENFKKTKA